MLSCFSWSYTDTLRSMPASLMISRIFFIVGIGPGLGEVYPEVKACALDDVETEPDDGSDDFLIGLLCAAGLGGDIMDVRDSFRADGHFFHGQAAEIAEAAAEAAVEDKCVLGPLEFLGDFGVNDFPELILSQEYGLSYMVCMTARFFSVVRRRKGDFMISSVFSSSLKSA